MLELDRWTSNLIVNRNYQKLGKNRILSFLFHIKTVDERKNEVCLAEAAKELQFRALFGFLRSTCDRFKVYLSDIWNKDETKIVLGVFTSSKFLVFPKRERCTRKRENARKLCLGLGNPLEVKLFGNI